ncbi:MAG TPA: hypothetical protein DCP63_15930, partial [Bacteroidetes bacterium]|nr:hypothetical protein [Bacteroidota bacterium]
MQPFSDEQLIWQIRSGSKTAFAKLYDRHKSKIFSYCCKLLHDEESAQDVLQETFMKALEAIETLEQPHLFRPWLYRIARNESYQLLRRGRNVNGGLSDEVWETLSDESTPLDRILDQERTNVVQYLLGLLKAEYREVLILREYEQLSYGEIAEITGDTESSV